MEGSPEHARVEAWKQNPWTKLPTWAKWTIGIVGALILLGIGEAVGSSGEKDLEDEVTELTQERNEAEAREAALIDRRDQVIAAAESKAAGLIGDARSESSEATSKLDRLKHEVSHTQDELAETESSLAGAEEEAALSTISNGIWKAEVDYIPGTYRAPGGPSCYWATLNSADPYDIASNENGTGPQIATIESPYFQSKGCGTWERIE
jgi:hypothetical protein